MILLECRETVAKRHSSARNVSELDIRLCFRPGSNILGGVKEEQDELHPGVRGEVDSVDLQLRVREAWHQVKAVENREHH